MSGRRVSLLFRFLIENTLILYILLMACGFNTVFAWWQLSDEQQAELNARENILVMDPATEQLVPLSELKSKNPKLTSDLEQLLRADRVRGWEYAKTFAANHGITIKDNMVRVMIKLNKKDTPKDSLSLEERYNILNKNIILFGGIVILRHEELVSAYIPLNALESLSNLDVVKGISNPIAPVPQ